jgi:DNA-binding HxlR family transcriptional regulator
MALGPGPLRTQQLTDRLNHLSPRSVYRHLGNMREHGLVGRQEDPGVPTRVVLSLTDPGRALFRLLHSFVETTMEKLPRQGNGAEPWDALSLLADFWDLGLLEELSEGPRSVVDLARRAHPMTYHQINRRAASFAASGLATSQLDGNGKRYQLTDAGRRCMGLVGGIGRWRQGYVMEDGLPGLTSKEMATVLRTVLPLIQLPQFVDMSIDIEVSHRANENSYRNPEVLRGSVGEDGAVQCEPQPQDSADGSAVATINTWFGVLLDGKRGRVKVRGNLSLVDACLTQIHERVWKSETSFATPPSSGAGVG